MAVFRIEKNRNYTVMSNYHLRDNSISCKACGLLSKMLALPDDWDYTTRGLAAICKDGLDSIRSALKELERAGYLERRQLRDDHGRMADVEYIIYETPRRSEPHTDLPYTENPNTVEPNTVFPDSDNPDPEKPTQLNTNIPITKEFSLPPSIVCWNSSAFLDAIVIFKSYPEACPAQNAALKTSVPIQPLPIIKTFCVLFFSVFEVYSHIGFEKRSSYALSRYSPIFAVVSLPSCYSYLCFSIFRV